MSQPKVFKIHADGRPGQGLKPINVIGLSHIGSGTATEIGPFDHIDPTRQVTVGIWECTLCVQYIPYYPCDGVCVILKGGLKITQKDGTTDYFGEGESEGLMALRGAKCHYGMTDVTKKYSIMFENKLQP